jgi:L-rhamnose mutarotase
MAPAKMKYQGKRIAQIVKLKPEHYQEYKKCHASVWPEVLRVIKRCNIEDCKSTHFIGRFHFYSSIHGAVSEIGD